MRTAEFLLVATVATPLAMLAACLSRRWRTRLPALLALAPLPALAAAVRVPESAPVLSFPAPFRLTLTLDRPAAMLLGAAALLWMIAGAYATRSLRDNPNAARFAEWWLLTLTGNLAVFIAADLVSFYLAYSVVSLAAWGLVVHDGTAASRRAGLVYAALAVVGEAFLLMAFVFMAQPLPSGDLSIRDAVAALPGSPWCCASLVLLLLGFGLKIGMVPGHVWMPLAYTAAPIPAAAALSGAAVKAGIIGLIRFLPLGVAMPEWGEALAIAGLLSAFYGVALGLTQHNPKTILAYSSVSQMGLLATALGMAWVAGDSGATAGIGFSAANHILVKGGLFLAVGVAASARPRWWPVLLPAAVLALGLAGLPLTGGALAKLAVKPALGTGRVAALAVASAVGSGLLMLHFLRRLVAEAGGRTTAIPAALARPWLAAAAAATALPWACYPLAQSGARSAALAPAALWAAVWPVLLGGVLVVAFRLVSSRMPQVPAGDIVVVGESGARNVVGWSQAIERADGWLRQWPVAMLSLVGFAILLAAALAARS